MGLFWLKLLEFLNFKLPRLSLAAERGHLQVVQELLAKQATDSMMCWLKGHRCGNFGTLWILF